MKQLYKKMLHNQTKTRSLFNINKKILQIKMQLKNIKVNRTKTFKKISNIIKN